MGALAIQAWDSTYAWPVFYQYATVVVTYFVMVTVCRQLTDVNWLIVTYIGTMYVYLAKSLWEFFVNDRHQFAQSVSRLVGIEYTYGEPNAVAMSAVLSLPLWYYLWQCRHVMTADVSLSWQRVYRLALSTFPMIVVIAVGLTNSRAGMVGLAAFTGGAIWYGQRRVAPVRSGVLAFIVLLTLWVVAPQEQKDRLRTLWNPSAGPANAQASAGGRWEGFLAAMQMLRDRPIAGVGVGNFVPYRVAYVDGVGLVAHNLPGQILGETGWFGGICFTALVIVMWRNIRRLRQLSSLGSEDFEVDEYRQLATALQLTMLLGFLFGLSLHNGLRYNWLWIAAFGCLACEFSETRSWQTEHDTDSDQDLRTAR